MEHPEHSQLWRHCQLPRPGEFADSHGGYSIALRQVSWGHQCEKPTWLYLVGVTRSTVEATFRRGGVATHRVTNGSRGDTSLPRVRNPHLSPPAFAEWLVSLARSVRMTEAA